MTDPYIEPTISSFLSFDEADKHFTNALHLLGGCQPNDLLPESDGLTAGRLTEIISAILALETTQ